MGGNYLQCQSFSQHALGEASNESYPKWFTLSRLSPFSNLVCVHKSFVLQDRVCQLNAPRLLSLFVLLPKTLCDSHALEPGWDVDRCALPVLRGTLVDIPRGAFGHCVALGSFPNMGNVYYWPQNPVSFFVARHLDHFGSISFSSLIILARVHSGKLTWLR